MPSARGGNSTRVPGSHDHRTWQRVELHVPPRRRGPARAERRRAVNVFVGWRNRVGTFFSGWTLRVAVVAVAAVPPVLYVAPLGLVVTLAGLILDCLGAITLAEAFGPAVPRVCG